MPKAPHPPALIVGLRLSGDHARLRAACRRRGLDYLALSPMRAQATTDWDRDALRADLRIFTSPTAVAAVRARDLPMQVQRPALAVGARSAALLRAAGVRSVGVADAPNVEALLRHPWLHQADVSRIAVFTAPDGRGDWRGLRMKGKRIEVVEVYFREPIALRDRAIDALGAQRGPIVTLASSEALLRQTWHALSTGRRQAITDGICVVSSQRLSGVARGLGFGRVLIAAGPSPAALAELAARALRGLA